MAIEGGTPLIAIDAAVIDTETTGLDPVKARLLEVAAVRIDHGRLSEAAPYRSLVRPGEPIPASATAVHGIDAAAVAEAPGFAAVWPEYAAYLGERLLIGHSLGFDLAILANECARVGASWISPRVLDIRLLAEAMRPDLAGFGLQALAAWLAVPVEARHSALGDALTAARIFLAMLPRLRESGIRTLAEAEQACRGLTQSLGDQQRAGWAEPIAPRGVERERERAARRLDVYPFRHRVADLMSKPQFCTPDSTIGSAARQMARARISSLFVANDEGDESPPPHPQETGIVTERDVLRAVTDHGSAALFLPVGKVASRPLRVIPADAFVYRAIGRMRRLKVRHLGVVDDDGRLCGAVSARDLLRQRAEEAGWIGDEIDEAADLPALARAWAKLPRVAESLIAEEVSGREIAAIVSREIGALTRRAAQLGEERMRAAGLGPPPCPYAVAVLGSAGRGESLLALDQDNALVFAEGVPDGPEDRWFAQLGTHVADILDEVGVPYCKGGVMAKNPDWRGSHATWRARIAGWIAHSRPQDLLSVDIFFDLRGVHDERGLVAALRREAYDLAAGQVGFAKLIAEAAGTVQPGLGWFGRFRTEHGRLDLKKSGLFGIVTAVRALAIRHHVVERSTPARLAGLKALRLGSERDLDTLAEAHAVFLDLMLRQQVEDVAQGLAPTNAVAIKRLSERNRDRLRDAIEAVRHLNELTRDLLFKSAEPALAADPTGAP